MFKQKLITVVIIAAFLATSCSDALNSNTDELTELEFMEPMTTALVSLEGEEATGNGIFVLNWNGLKPPFAKQEDDKLAMAMAIGFDEEVSLLPPHKHSTVEMGIVTIESAKDEKIELKKKKRRFSEDQIVYSHSSMGPFQNNQPSITFDLGGAYTIKTSGSDHFPSLNLAVQAPEKQVTILTPSAHRLEDYSGGIDVTWDAVEGRPVAIHIRPAFNPKEGEKPGKFDREKSEMILLEDQNGSYTITEEVLNKVADQTGAKNLHISVGQLQVSDFDSGGQTYRVIMRSADHRMVQIN